jgi:hypothetical protein
MPGLPRERFRDLHALIQRFEREKRMPLRKHNAS